MKRNTSRRDFLKTSAVAGAGFWVSGSSVVAESKSPNEKLNIAIIGCGGKGYSDMRGCASENIVALCDVDENRAAKAFSEQPKANKYHDYRKLLDIEKSLDAVVVATPDHHHAPASLRAMRNGLGVYTQKPLTHSIYEARLMRDTAREYKVATQMGNQGTSQRGLREGVEVVQSGGIGAVREAHIWTNRPVWPQGIKVGRLPSQRVPSTMKWDLWLGAAPDRLYNEGYAPFNWRGWWDFGTGALGDMACHTANLAFMALKLEYPTRVHATKVDGLNSETYPDGSTIRYDFPTRGNLPPVSYHWYDGTHKPPAEVTEGLGKLATSGSLMIGDEGKLYSPNDYGAHYVLHPKEKFEEYKPPKPWLPRSRGHSREWIDASKGGVPAMSNFDYAALLTETILIGNIAMRAGQAIDWDGPRMRVTNSRTADQYVSREYRKGWEVS